MESVLFLQHLLWEREQGRQPQLSAVDTMFWFSGRTLDADKDTAVKDDVAEPPGSVVSRPQVCDREQLNFIITLSPMVFFIVFFTTGTKGSGLILAEWRTSLVELTAL